MQRHNEEKLNEAFRTAPGVFLAFSVNMSGHFQGYARMASPASRQQARSIHVPYPWPYLWRAIHAPYPWPLPPTMCITQCA